MPIALKIIMSTTRPGRGADRVLPWLVERLRPMTASTSMSSTCGNGSSRIPETYETIGDRDDPTYSDPMVRAWNRKVAEGDAFVFVTAEYNHSVPGELKNALDSVFVSFAFRNKPVAFVGYSGGPIAAARAVEHLAHIMIEAEAAPLRNTVLIGGVGQAFDDAGSAEQPDTDAALRVMKDDVAWWSDALRRPGRGSAAAGQRPPDAGAGRADDLRVGATGRGKMSAMKVVDTLRSVLHFRPHRARSRWPAGCGRRRRSADLRRIARRRLPRGVFDYIDGGRRGRADAAQQRRRLRPHRVPAAGAALGRGRSTRRRRCSAGPLPFPLVLAPTGFTRIADPQGELAVARAADRAGLPYTLSTLATRSIEEVAAVSGGRKWFQVYAWRDRGIVKDMVDRCAAVRLRGARAHGRHGGARAARARRASRFRAPAEARASARCSTAPCTPGGRGRSPAPSRSCSPMSPGGGPGTARATAPTPSRCRRTSTRSSTPTCRGTTSTGCARSGTVRSCSRASSRVADAVLAAERGVDADRPVEPRRPPARLGAGADRPRGPGRRRGRRAHRDHLRRRGAPGERHRQGGRPRGDARAWPAGRTCTPSPLPASAASTTSSGCWTPTSAAPWPSSAPPPSPISPPTSSRRRPT